MSDNKNVNQDKGLQGNEKIEQAIAALQQEATQEMLAHTLTVIRRRMRENGQFILSVEPPTGDNQLRIGTVKTGDGKVWWAAFTSFEEELKGLKAELAALDRKIQLELAPPVPEKDISDKSQTENNTIKLGEFHSDTIVQQERKVRLGL
mgnify:CR=1 FL=1